MEDWQKWVVVVAGVVAVVDQFVPDVFLNVIGGAVAAVVALLMK